MMAKRRLPLIDRNRDPTPHPREGSAELFPTTGLMTDVQFQCMDLMLAV
jgi:hypothetical protein